MYPSHLPKDYTGEQLFDKFSNCPCAFECSLFDLYSAECEAGQVMQKCFKTIHNRLDFVDLYLLDPAKRAAKKQSNQQVHQQKPDDR